jgi:hypothetical protein
MTHVTHAWPAQHGYVDLEKFILLGPDAALIPSRGYSEAGPRPSAGSRSDEWMLELYDGDEDPIRVLIAGGDE